MQIGWAEAQAEDTMRKRLRSLQNRWGITYHYSCPFDPRQRMTIKAARLLLLSRVVYRT